MRMLLCWLCGLLLVVGCTERPPAEEAPPEASAVPPGMFAGLPVLPGSRIVGGSADAAEAVVAVWQPTDSVARFYRNVLAERAWDIRGDATAPDGQVTLYARSAEGRPIWIRIRPTAADRSEVSFIAAAADTAGADR